MDSFLLSALTTLGYSLPELLACGIALAMLWTAARPGRARRLGLIGIGLMLACAMLQLAAGLYQTWMINPSLAHSTAELGRSFAWLGSVRLLINCVSLAGLVIVVWGLCMATRPEAARRPHVLPQ